MRRNNHLPVGRGTPCAPASDARPAARRGLTRPTIARAELRALRLSLPAGIERDTFLMPRAIAESVCAEASRFLDEEFPARYVDWLVIKAHRCYSAHRHFYKLMQAQGNVARDRLYMFMRHWLASFLHLERPDLFCCLPVTFGDGRRLPHGTHPRIRRNGGCYAPLPNPRGWNEQRVFRHFRWSWLCAATSESERKTSQNALTATDQQIDELVYDLRPGREGTSNHGRHPAGWQRGLALDPSQVGRRTR